MIMEDGGLQNEANMKVSLLSSVNNLDEEDDSLTESVMTETDNNCDTMTENMKDTEISLSSRPSERNRGGNYSFRAKISSKNSKQERRSKRINLR